MRAHITTCTKWNTVLEGGISNLTINHDTRNSTTASKKGIKKKQIVTPSSKMTSPNILKKTSGARLHPKTTHIQPYWNQLFILSCKAVQINAVNTGN